MNVTVVLEGPRSGKGEREALIRRENTPGVEYPGIARDRMRGNGAILPD